MMETAKFTFPMSLFLPSLLIALPENRPWMRLNHNSADSGVYRNLLSSVYVFAQSYGRKSESQCSGKELK